MYGAFFRGSKQAILIRAGLLIGAIALVDWRIVDEIPLHFLYLLPMLMVGNVLAPWELAASSLPWPCRETRLADRGPLSRQHS